MITYRGNDVKIKLIQTDTDYKIVLIDNRSGNKRTYCALSNLSTIAKTFDELVEMDKNGEFKWDEEV